MRLSLILLRDSNVYLSLISVTVSWRPRQKSPQNLPSAKENEEVLLLVVIPVKHCALTISEIPHLFKEKKMLTRFPKQLKIRSFGSYLSGIWILLARPLWMFILFLLSHHSVTVVKDQNHFLKKKKKKTRNHLGPVGFYLTIPRDLWMIVKVFFNKGFC